MTHSHSSFTGSAGYQMLSALSLLAVGAVCAYAQPAPYQEAPQEPIPAQPTFLTGGPLAGEKLPPFARGNRPEVYLYPGSVEHWRAYFMKYLPERSFFDQQSLIKNWVAPGIPGAAQGAAEEFAEPVYSFDRYGPTGRTKNFRAPVAVVRCKEGSPTFKLDLGTLDPGMYAIRVIAAVPTDKLRPFLLPLFLKTTVNDGLDGSPSTYRMRIGYIDNFYSVAEVYFNAPECRAYHAELGVDKGSQVDLLVHNITLDDVLAGSTRRPIKTRQTLTTPEILNSLKANIPAELKKEFAAHKTFTPEQRLQRDQEIWDSIPPLNAQGSWSNFDRMPANYKFGTADMTQEQIEAKWGKWEFDSRPDAPFGALIVNNKLGLSYTLADYRAHKPLPDPYPIKEDPSGLFFPDPDNPAAGRIMDNIASGITWKIRGSGPGTPDQLYNPITSWLQSGIDDYGRDAAIRLVDYAYHFPSFDASNYFTTMAVNPGPFGRDSRFLQREEYMRWSSFYGNYEAALKQYDRLFPYIKGNEALAQSIHRFVPWVHTSSDVIQLLDTYLVQTTAKKVLRYQWHVIPSTMALCSATVGDTNISDPWMEWLFSKAFQYPLQLAGVQDLLIDANEREGPQQLGSTFYSQAQSALGDALAIYPYVHSGGNPKYNLLDPKAYPKVVAHPYWQLNTVVGGQDFLRIGDVSGPDKSPGWTLTDGTNFRWGWKLTKDPKFAWIIANVFGRLDETDAEWAEVQAAAATVKRAPWLDAKSRDLYNWAGILESGQQHDDYRFHRSVYLRTGIGMGHDHADTLDLEGVMHGVPFTVDGGQRSGYTKPNDKFTRIHNTVQVDAGGNEEYGIHTTAWIQALSDAPGARYERANAVPPPGARLFRRQVALIDVDEGNGSRPLTAAEQRPQLVKLADNMKAAPLPTGITPANSYVFDVFRVAGGDLHTYCFHGPVQDEFKTNLLNPTPVRDVPPDLRATDDPGYLSIFEASGGAKFAGGAPDILEATWRQSRSDKMGGEQQMLGANYSEAAPRLYTKWHLLDASKLHVLQADSVSNQFGYRITNLMAQQRGTNLETVFPAIIEPYAGVPFIQNLSLLPVDNNDTDAQRAVAVQVKTINGHQDICLTDGHPEKTRTAGNISFSGEFGYYSTDAQGLRQATLTGGTKLSGPELQLTAAQGERVAKITAVDYARKAMHVDGTWPAAAGDRQVEIVGANRSTSYTLASAAPGVNGSDLSVTRGADYFRSPITQVLPEESRVDCALGFPIGTQPGLDKGWVASNDQGTKFWRVKKLDSNDFTLEGGPVSAADFAPSNAMRLWEYGVGDTLRQSTYVSLNRANSGVYRLEGDVDVTLGFKGGAIQFSKDGNVWRDLPAQKDGGWVFAKVGLSQLPAGPVWIKVSG